MDQRTIGQILNNPEWLRQTYGESERTIQQQPLPPGGAASYVPAPAPYYDYQQPALQAQQPVPVRPESRPIEVRGQIAYVARFRAEYFNPADQPTMMTLAQAVIMNQTGAEPGEAPPPWFPDVQFWIQSFEVIDPYATAQQQELERLHAAKLEQEAAVRIREAQQVEQLRRERMLYGEPGTFSREGTLTGLAVEPARGDLQGGGASADWLGDIFRELTTAIGGIHERLESLERRDGGAGGADPALHPDNPVWSNPDPGRGEREDRRADQGDPGDGGAADAHALDAVPAPADRKDRARGGDLEEPGRADEPARPRPPIDQARRKAAVKEA